MKIGFIGTGAIAQAMIISLAGNGHKICVSARNTTVSSALAAKFDEVDVAGNQAVLDRSDVVFLCLMADVAPDILGALSFRKDHVMISAMVDMDLGALATCCAPASKISITIPLPFVADGGCPLPVYPPSTELEALFGANNVVIPLSSEDQINPHFAATATLSPIVEQLVTAANWLGEKLDDQQLADTYVTQLYAGLTQGFTRDLESFRTTLASLSTEGGLNATLRAQMNTHGTPKKLREGLEGFSERLGLN
jgi:pyrroline-5-carboxylate reductase